MRATHQHRPLLIVGVVCTTFLAGMAASGLIGSAGTPDRSGGSNARSAPTEQSSSGPAKYRNGIPAGFARSKDGARAAAVGYVLTGQVLINLPAQEMDRAIRAMSSAGSADEQVSTAEQQLDQVRSTLAPGTGPTRYVQAVLATRIDAFGPDRARVSVWNVGVLSRVGVAAPQAGWSTSVLDLVWERGDWKLWGDTTDPGPSPALNAGDAPATSEALEAALGGFTPWEPSS